MTQTSEQHELTAVRAVLLAAMAATMTFAKQIAFR
jgi:hypothetical protein